MEKDKNQRDSMLKNSNKSKEKVTKNLKFDNNSSKKVSVQTIGIFFDEDNSETKYEPKKNFKPDFSQYMTEQATIYRKKSPLNKLSINIKPNKLKNKTSIELDKFNNIKKFSQKLIEKSENINDSKIIDDAESDHDSDTGDDKNEKEINFLLNKDLLNQNKKKFEQLYPKYYMPSSENISGNYDMYVTKCIKLVTTFEAQTYFRPATFEIQEKIAPTLNISKDKILLILDMDETLIHSDLECKFTQHDVYIEAEGGLIPLNIRPNLFEFLDFCEQYFDIVIFTASCKDYADPILDFIEKNKKYFKNRFYREHCISYHNLFLKDLSIFNKDENKTIIVDNCLFSFAHYLKNGVLITSYYNDPEDLDLMSLVEFFKSSILNCPDVRVEIENTFEFYKIYQAMLNDEEED